MTFNELRADLGSKLDKECYFSGPLFKYETKQIRRRSFRDLFWHYRSKGVTEPMLMKALFLEGLSAKVCLSARNAVFCGIYHQAEDTFWADDDKGLGFTYGTSINMTKCGKYTKEVLDAIYEKSKDYDTGKTGPRRNRRGERDRSLGEYRPYSQAESERILFR